MENEKNFGLRNENYDHLGSVENKSSAILGQPSAHAQDTAAVQPKACEDAQSQMLVFKEKVDQIIVIFTFVIYLKYSNLLYNRGD